LVTPSYDTLVSVQKQWFVYPCVQHDTKWEGLPPGTLSEWCRWSTSSYSLQRRVVSI